MSKCCYTYAFPTNITFALSCLLFSGVKISHVEKQFAAKVASLTGDGRSTVFMTFHFLYVSYNIEIPLFFVFHIRLNCTSHYNIFVIIVFFSFILSNSGFK